ncbi:MAG TPA: hypothetical protein VG649_12990 [Candidatus Angelobacter sp.]|jgi:hypothetical protein|nr:hypothetical protein [Candidatus Angelobacter sp.]
MKKKAAATVKRSSSARKTSFGSTDARPAKKSSRSRQAPQLLLEKIIDGAALTQLPAVRQAIAEEAVARKYVLTRYRTLIDRKYLEGLSSQESEELNGLQVALDKMDEPFYEGIIKHLRTLVDRGIVA